MLFGWNSRATLNSEDDPEDLGGNLEGRGEVPGELGGELIRGPRRQLRGLRARIRLSSEATLRWPEKLRDGNTETGQPGSGVQVSVINGRMKQRAARRLPRRTSSPGQSASYRWFVLSGAPASHTCGGPVFLCRRRAQGPWMSTRPANFPRPADPVGRLVSTRDLAPVVPWLLSAVARSSNSDESDNFQRPTRLARRDPPLILTSSTRFARLVPASDDSKVLKMSISHLAAGDRQSGGHAVTGLPCFPRRVPGGR
jgi:hypothetical protein